MFSVFLTASIPDTSFDSRKFDKNVNITRVVWGFWVNYNINMPQIVDCSYKFPKNCLETESHDLRNNRNNNQNKIILSALFLKYKTNI